MTSIRELSPALMFFVCSCAGAIVSDEQNDESLTSGMMAEESGHKSDENDEDRTDAKGEREPLLGGAPSDAGTGDGGTDASGYANAAPRYNRYDAYYSDAGSIGDESPRRLTYPRRAHHEESDASVSDELTCWEITCAAYEYCRRGVGSLCETVASGWASMISSCPQDAGSVSMLEEVCAPPSASVPPVSAAPVAAPPAPVAAPFAGFSVEEEQAGASDDENEEDDGLRQRLPRRSAKDSTK